MAAESADLSMAPGLPVTSPLKEISVPKNTSIDYKDFDSAEAQVSPDVADGDMICTSDYMEQKYKKLTKKIDLYLMPMMFFFYGMQQTDKTSISIQALFGMEDDLGLHGQQYQWLTTIFYITYLVGEFPRTCFAYLLPFQG